MIKKTFERILIYILLIIMIISLVGCASKAAETLASQEQGGEQQKETTQQLDKEKISTFVAESARDVFEYEMSAKDIIETYDFSSADVTGDGMDEVILIPKNEMWNNIFVVQEEQGMFKMILNEKGAQSGVKVSVVDGFLKLEKSFGGTGAASMYMDLWKWNGSVMQKALGDVVLFSQIADKDGNIMEQQTAMLVGAITEFEYTLIMKDQTNHPEGNIAQHCLYSWNESTGQFMVENLQKAVPTDNEATFEILEIKWLGNDADILNKYNRGNDGKLDSHFQITISADHIYKLRTVAFNNTSFDEVTKWECLRSDQHMSSDPQIAAGIILDGKEEFSGMIGKGKHTFDIYLSGGNSNLYTNKVFKFEEGEKFDITIELIEEDGTKQQIEEKVTL